MKIRDPFVFGACLDASKFALGLKVGAETSLAVFPASDKFHFFFFPKKSNRTTRIQVRSITKGERGAQSPGKEFEASRHKRTHPHKKNYQGACHGHPAGSAGQCSRARVKALTRALYISFAATRSGRNCSQEGWRGFWYASCSSPPRAVPWHVRAGPCRPRPPFRGFTPKESEASHGARRAWF